MKDDKNLSLEEIQRSLENQVEEIDYFDEKKLISFSMETVYLSEEYRRSRTKYSEAKITLNKFLAQFFRLGKIRENLALDKAYLRLIELQSELLSVYQQMIGEEQAYKGLERVIEARKAFVSLHQSFIKNKSQQDI